MPTLIPSPTGVLGDPRLDPKVQNGFRAEEVIAGDSPLLWLDRPASSLRNFSIMNQNGSSACVAFAKAKQLAIEIFLQTGVYIELSPASIYQLRINRPGLGMQISDANNIVNTRGATLEALMKSQNLTEAQIHAVKRSKVADLLALALAEAVVSYFYFPTVDIDKIAQAIETGKGVSLLIFANFNEYDSDPAILQPSLTYEDAQIKHEVVAVDYMLRQGTKTLWIEDSWGVGNGMGGRREFSEAFVEKRVILADFLSVLDFEGGVGEKPQYDGTIISLQKCLRFEGLFPLDVPLAETYGPVTKASVIKFQKKYGIEPALGNFGPVTKAKVKSLYP